jgi:hypothetical protein
VSRRNRLDLALYHRAAALFHGRVRAAGGGVRAGGQMIFSPALNQTINVGDIPGRLGFDAVEDIGAAWLRADRPARIYFRAPAGTVRVRMRFYSLTADYPIDKIIVALNGNQLSHTVVWTEPHWLNLMASAGELQGEVNELSIDPPVFLSVRQVSLDTPDQRYLAIALGNIRFLG